MLLLLCCVLCELAYNWAITYPVCLFFCEAIIIKCSYVYNFHLSMVELSMFIQIFIVRCLNSQSSTAAVFIRGFLSLWQWLPRHFVLGFFICSGFLHLFGIHIYECENLKNLCCFLVKPGELVVVIVSMKLISFLAAKILNLDFCRILTFWTISPTVDLYIICQAGSCLP